MNPPVGRKHFVLKGKGLNRRYRAFSAISPAHHYGAANPISLFFLGLPEIYKAFIQDVPFLGLGYLGGGYWVG